jgi:RhtB (resistance to homoserine/threonine) family protein
MFGIENYLGFVIACIALNITPGADTLYILTRSISQGKTAGIYSVLGISTGGVVHTLLISFGLSLILAKSVLTFTIIKYLGVSYLIYLGIKMVFENSQLFETNSAKMESCNRIKIFRQGVFTNVSNPKVILFFLSFLPQFINPVHAKGPLPFAILGLTFVTTGTFWCMFLVIAASKITTSLRKNEKTGMIMQKLCGIVFVGLGLKILLDR